MPPRAAPSSRPGSPSGSTAPSGPRSTRRCAPAAAWRPGPRHRTVGARRVRPGPSTTPTPRPRCPARPSAARATRSPATSRSTRRPPASRRRWRCSPRCSRRDSHDDAGALGQPDRPLRLATTTTPSGTAPSSSSATATAGSSSASPSRSTCSAHEFSHAVVEHTAGLVYQGQSGALNESVCRRLRLLPQAAAARPGRRRRRLADRRGHLHAVGAARGPCATWPRPARRTTTPSSAPTRRSATWTTTSRPPTTTAGSTSTPASPTAPSTWRRSPWAARRSKARAGSGTPRSRDAVQEDADFAAFATACVAAAGPTPRLYGRRGPGGGRRPLRSGCRSGPPPAGGRVVRRGGFVGRTDRPIDLDDDRAG